MPKPIKTVLVVCEESQTVCKTFLRYGDVAYSVDIKPCSGGIPHRHLQMDAMALLQDLARPENRYRVVWRLAQDGNPIPLVPKDIDLIIIHPPCTYLSVAGNRAFKTDPDRHKKRECAMAFATQMWDYACATGAAVVLENPVGYLNTHWKKPSQIFHPWQYGDDYLKRTCLWVQGVPCLSPTVEKEPPNVRRKWVESAKHMSDEDRREIRSKFSPWVADAMAKQWG